MKKFLIHLSALLTLLFAVYANAFADEPKHHGPYAAGGSPFALVEYYNSENCLHCRKPTEVVREIADKAIEEDERVFILTYHVDYLQIDDWKDIYENAKYSERQRQYNKELRQRIVLPGQVIINGKFPALAEYTDYVDQAIARMLDIRSKAVLRVKTYYIPETRTIAISYTVDGLRDVRREFFYLRVALAEDGIVRKITQGPNAGYTFRHSNIVRAFETSRFSKDWKGSAEIVIPTHVSKEKAVIVCFVEDPITLQIYAAERIFVDEIKERPADKDH